MLTVNADEHPVMRQLHKPGDEKRTPVIIQPEHYTRWLRADVPNAEEMMSRVWIAVHRLNWVDRGPLVGSVELQLEAGQRC